MKKLKLEELNLGSVEVLSREELKKVLGGLGSGGGSGDAGCLTQSGGCDEGGICILWCTNGTTQQGTCGSSNHGTYCACAGIC